MIGFLKRWFRRDAFGFREGRRRIFPYFDGRKNRKGDPLAIHRALLSDPECEMQYDPSLAGLPNLEGMKAAGRLAAAVKRSFDIPPVAEGGLTEAECLLLFAEFGKFVAMLREAAGPLVSSPGSTPACQSESFPTENSPASGFTPVKTVPSAFAETAAAPPPKSSPDF